MKESDWGKHHLDMERKIKAMWPECVTIAEMTVLSDMWEKTKFRALPTDDKQKEEKEMKTDNGFWVKDNALGFNGDYLETIDLLKVDPKIADNQKHQKEILNNRDSDFYGGTLEDARSVPDLTTFQKAKKKLENSGFKKRFEPFLSMQARRRRVKNEYDGDFDFDARWDVRPFTSGVRIKTLIPHVNIIADFCFSSQYSPGEIDAYGAFVWSIIQLIESTGMSTSVFLKFSSEGMSRTPGREWNGEMRIKVKNGDEYVSPIAMASCFRSVYFRRIIFNAMVVLSDRFGTVAKGGLGSARPFLNPVSFENGELKISIGASGFMGDVEREVMKMFGDKNDN